MAPNVPKLGGGSMLIRETYIPNALSGGELEKH